MAVLITITSAGSSTGPFNLYSNTDGFTIPFETNIPKANLLSGYNSVLVPVGTTTVQIKSLGTCTNSINIGVSNLPTTTITPTTTTSTTSTTLPITTTTDNPLLAACYEVEGFWELGDPIHSNGGSITYLDQYGVSHTILNITLSNGIISIIASSIVTSVGVDVTVVTCPTTAPPTTTTAGPAYTNLSQAVGGLNCPAVVSSYPYSVVASTNPIQIGTQINFTSGLPFDLNGSGYYYITPFIGYQINSLGIVTAINDCQGA